MNIRLTLEKEGWRSLDDDLWDRLADYQTGVLFLAPPLDTVPSPRGNAIYTIIQDLAQRSPVPCLVVSIWPFDRFPSTCEISNRIIYLQNPFRSVPFERYLPYRLKREIWGMGRPELLNYAEKTAILCNHLKIQRVVIEDVPRFGLFFKSPKNSKTKVFLHQHNNAPIGYSKCWWQKIKQAYSGFIFVSRTTLQELERIHEGLENTTAIYNGVDLDQYDPNVWVDTAQVLKAANNIQDNELVVLYVGRIIPGKGCLELVQSFLQADVLDAKLVVIGSLSNSIYGSEDYLAQLKMTASASKGKIILTNTVLQKDLPGWYQAADIVAVPSIQPEGLPKVVTEALAMGKPIMASNRGGTLELVRPGENGWVIQNPTRIEDFAALLRRVLSNRDEIKAFGQNVLEKDRKNMSIERSAKQFFDFVLQ